MDRLDLWSSFPEDVSWSILRKGGAFRGWVSDSRCEPRYEDNSIETPALLPRLLGERPEVLTATLGNYLEAFPAPL